MPIKPHTHQIKLIHPGKLKCVALERGEQAWFSKNRQNHASARCKSCKNQTVCQFNISQFVSLATKHSALEFKTFVGLSIQLISTS